VDIWLLRQVWQAQGGEKINEYSFSEGEMEESILRYCIPVLISIIQRFSYRLLEVIPCEN